jgi:hypothetical protein
MWKFLRRIFAGAAPETNVGHLGGGGHTHRDEVNDWLRQSGLHVENRPPPMPGIVEVATADAISQIFSSDVARQEAEHASHAMQRSAFGGAISFNRPK